MPETYSEIDPLVLTLVAKLIGGEGCSVNLHARQGKISKTYEVYSENASYILRLSSADNASLYDKEHTVMKLLSDNAIEGAKSVSFGVEQGFAYSLQTCIPRAPGASLNLESPSVSAKLWKAIGEAIKDVHRIKTPGFGGKVLLANPVSLSFKEHIVECERYCFRDEARLAPHFSSAELSFFKDSIKSLEERTFTESILCHGDLSPDNCIVRDSPNGFKVTLIDWGLAEGSMGLLRDLVELLVWNVPKPSVDAFYEGYGADPEIAAPNRELLLELGVLRLLGAVSYLVCDHESDFKTLDGVRFVQLLKKCEKLRDLSKLYSEDY